MKETKANGIRNLLRVVAILLLVSAGWQQRGFSLGQVTGAEQARARDGAHDFDFNIGVWHTHIRRVLDPFSASSDVVELNGTVTIRPVWGGRARLEEIEADGPKGHWEGLSLFLYNPQSHQWSQSFLNSKSPAMSGGLVGEFHDGRGELYAHDTFHDKSIFVRGVWSEITPNSHRYTESYSNDGGNTWFTSFDAHKTREEDLPPSDMAAGAEPMSADPDGHAFDFDLGTWHTQSSRLMHPLTGSTTWADLEWQTVVHRVWGGRAPTWRNMWATARLGTCNCWRWSSIQIHEWNLDFATPNVGRLGEPGVGQCKDGRCSATRRSAADVWIRFSIWKISEDSAQSEQAFSNDGGRSWEINWINKYTRMKN